MDKHNINLMQLNILNNMINSSLKTDRIENYDNSKLHNIKCFDGYILEFNGKTSMIKNNFEWSRNFTMQVYHNNNERN